MRCKQARGAVKYVIPKVSEGAHSMSIKPKIFILFALISPMVVGCSSHYWYQESKTFNQCRLDYLQCNHEAETYAGDHTGLTFYESSPRSRPKARKGYNIYGFGGRDRAGFRYDCMWAKGYRLVSAKQLPPEWKQTRNLREIADWP